MPFELEQNNCVICLNDLTFAPVLKRTCSHVFHKDCLKKYYLKMFKEGAVNVLCFLCNCSRFEDTDNYRSLYRQMLRRNRRVQHQILLRQLKEKDQMRKWNETTKVWFEYEEDCYQYYWKSVKFDRDLVELHSYTLTCVLESWYTDIFLYFHKWWWNKLKRKNAYVEYSKLHLRYRLSKITYARYNRHLHYILQGWYLSFAGQIYTREDFIIIKHLEAVVTRTSLWYAYCYTNQVNPEKPTISEVIKFYKLMLPNENTF